MTIEFIINQPIDFSINLNIKKRVYHKSPRGLLLFDDNTLLLRNLRIMLKNKGFEVFTASSEMEGIKIFKENKKNIGIILLDSFLSDSTGLEMFSIFRTLDPEIKILLIIHENMDMSFWENLEINSFIVEPIELNSLITVIKQLF